MNSCQDLPCVGADGDGVEGTETNASDRDDSDNSYVFVNGSDGTSDDPGANELDTAVSAETKGSEETHTSAQGNGATLLTCEFSSDLDGEKIVDGMTQVDSSDLVENQMEAVESQKYDCEVELNPHTSQDQVDLKSPSVTAYSQDANQITLEINLYSADKQINFDSVGQNNIDLTIDENNSDSLVDVVNSDLVDEKTKLDSANHLDLTDIAERGENNQDIVMEADECESQTSDIRKVNYVDQTLLPSDELEEEEKCRTPPSDDLEFESLNAKMEVREVNDGHLSQVMSTKPVEPGEFYSHISIHEDSISCELDHEVEKHEKACIKDIGSDASINTEFGGIGVLLDQGHEIENVVNEHSSMETGRAISPVLCEKEDNALVSQATDHVSLSEEVDEKLDVGESSHELSISSEEAKILGAPAACMTSEVHAMEHQIETTEKVSADCVTRNEATESISVEVAEVLEPKSYDEDVSCAADGTCAIVMNSLVNGSNPQIVFGCQNSASEEVCALSGESSFHDSKLQNLYSGDTVVESRYLGDDSIASCYPTDTNSETTLSLMTDKSEQKVQSGTEISNEGADLSLGQSSSTVAQLSEVGDSSTSIDSNVHGDDNLEPGLESLRSSIDNNVSPNYSQLMEVQYNNSENHYPEATVVESTLLCDDSITSCSPTDSAASETTLSLMTDKSEQKVQTGTVISDKGAELVFGQSFSIVVQVSEVGNLSSSFKRDMHGDNNLESLRSFVDNNGSPNHTKNMEGQCNDSGRNSDENLVFREHVVAEKSWSNETSETLLEGSSANVIARQDVRTATVGGLKKPFQFLIKMPRFDDENLREQIRLAQLHVDEKTRCRDAIWQEIKKKRANCQHHGVEFESAKSEERAARKQVRSKRAEIEQLQTAINRVKNAISIEEIDARICSMEHMIEHETILLKEEKNLIREIRQLKQLRDQLTSNIGSRDEVQQAMDNKAQNEESLKILKKELDSLKNKASEAEAVAVAVSLRYEEESKMHKELRTQYKVANEIRQAEYENLQKLKKALYDKNKHFRMYKDDASAASGHAAQKDTEALHRLCSNQVEKYMELWYRDDEFRREYVRCNMKSTVRRLGTLDGRSLGPDEDPPILPVYVAERNNKVISNSSRVDLGSPTLPLPLAPQQEKAVILVKDEDTATNPVMKVAGKEAEVESKTGSVKPNLDVSDWEMKKEDVKTKEELELARKEEELRKLEIAARLKEQRRLEEIAKANEALERKKRNAEKAQVRAELRAQKEAEQREKEREKRLRKKERKKGGDATNENETSSVGESVKDAVSETETTKEDGKKPQKAPLHSKQSKTKSIPPPLRNKSKRKMQQWMRIILTSVVVIALFLLGNIGFFASLKHRQNVS